LHEKIEAIESGRNGGVVVPFPLVLRNHSRREGLMKLQFAFISRLTESSKAEKKFTSSRI
jgi:hypothetical protein